LFWILLFPLADFDEEDEPVKEKSVQGGLNKVLNIFKASKEEESARRSKEEESHQVSTNKVSCHSKCQTIGLRCHAR
jgi:hypothetical protein